MTARKLRLTFVSLVLAFPLSALAQGTSAVRAADYGKWESPAATALSPDGKWLAYGVNRVDETTEVRLRNLATDSFNTYAMGSSPRFSATSRWLAYSVAPTPAAREKLERDKKPVRNTAAVVDLSTGTSTSIAQTTSFAFSADGKFLAVRTYPSDASKRDAADLIVRDLLAGTSQTFGNIAAFAWSDAGSLLAMTIETEGNSGNGVQLLDASNGRLSTLVSSTDRYRALAWRDDAADLAVLRSLPISGSKDTSNVILAWKNANGNEPQSFTLDPVSHGQEFRGLRIAEQRAPEWSRDGSTIYLGVRDVVTQTSDSAKPDSSRPKVSDVQVWHARDVRPIPQQKAQEQADRRRTMLAAWHLADNKIVRVGSRLFESVTLSVVGRYAVETSAMGYEFGAMFGRPQHDVDVVDLQTGARRRIVDSTRVFGGLSPAGRYVAWFRNGAWWVRETSDAMTARNLTSAINTVFEDRDDDHPLPERGPHGLAGWSEDDRWLYVYDKYDLWRLATDGSRSERLTRGAEDSVVHRIVRLNDDEPRNVVDLSKGLYLMLRGEWTKKSGYARLRPGQSVAQRLVFDDAALGRLIRADSADVLAFTRERFDSPPAWMVGNAALANPRQVAQLNEFQRDYAWGRAELVEFTSDSGQRLQGALYYPAGYDSSKKYPMIVNTYEIMSTGVHNYQVPSERSYYNRTAWTSQGYFVFTPDIVFRAGDPGRSYLECLIPAVRSVIARGIVDSARIGLVGHSWGGYEATYAPTQTNLFATSIAGAPITNFLSFAGAFHWTPGFPEFDHWETGQARMVKPPWEDFEGHVRNSPAAFVHKLERPMLMMFGDADGTVDWHQGVEFYNFARRAGKDDFVMLVYPGEDHGLRKKENQIDYHRRILQWFGHWLKGEPPAEWIKRGVTWEERKAVVNGGR